MGCAFVVFAGRGPWEKSVPWFITSCAHTATKIRSFGAVPFLVLPQWCLLSTLWFMRRAIRIGCKMNYKEYIIESETCMWRSTFLCKTDYWLFWIARIRTEPVVHLIPSWQAFYSRPLCLGWPPVPPRTNLGFATRETWRWKQSCDQYFGWKEVPRTVGSRLVIGSIDSIHW